MIMEEITPKEHAKELMDSYNSILIEEIGDEFNRRDISQLCSLLTIRKMIEWCDAESQPHLEQVEQELIDL